MSLSSFCVCMNALRLNLIKLKKDKPVEKKTSENTSEKGQAFSGALSVGNDENENTSERGLSLFGAHSGDSDDNKDSGERSETMEKVISIEGMVCAHCEATVKKALEEIEGVEAAEASAEKKQAVVKLSADVADDVLKKAVEDRDYKVTGIE